LKAKRKKRRRKFPIKDWKKAKRKGKGKKISEQRLEENKRNIPKGLWTRQYLNNTEFSPQANKKRKEITT